MKASVGDRLVLASSMVDGAVRDGTVVAVRHADGSPPYTVRWHDTGEESLVFPGPDAHVERGAEPAEGAARPRWDLARPADARHERARDHGAGRPGGRRAGPPRRGGRARRNPADSEVEVIGDEVAVARALHRLADRLIDYAQRTDLRQHGRARPRPRPDRRRPGPARLPAPRPVAGRCSARRAVTPALICGTVDSPGPRGPTRMFHGRARSRRGGGRRAVAARGTLAPMAS